MHPRSGFAETLHFSPCWGDVTVTVPAQWCSPATHSTWEQMANVTSTGLKEQSTQQLTACKIHKLKMGEGKQRLCSCPREPQALGRSTAPCRRYNTHSTDSWTTHTHHISGLAHLDSLAEFSSNKVFRVFFKWGQGEGREKQKDRRL